MALDKHQPQSDDVLSTEQQVLDDVHRRTGFSYPRLGSINTADRTIARAVLPVLAEWAPAVAVEGVRHAIYDRFVTQHATPFIKTLIDWAKGEPHVIGQGLLIHAVAVATTRDVAEDVWLEIDNLPRTGLRYLLLARLANMPNTSGRARKALLNVLETGAVSRGDLSFIATVDDPRIRSWFSQQLTSPDSVVRRLAKRVIERGKKLPAGIEFAVDAPRRGDELFSTEADINEISEVLGRCSRDFQIDIPAMIVSGSVFARLPLDRWIIARCKGPRQDWVCVWCRLEDVDIVEVVISRDCKASLEN